MDRRTFIALGSITVAALSQSPADGQAKKEYVCPPCDCANDGKVFEAPGNCTACGMGLVEKSALRELAGIPNLMKLDDRVWTAGQPSMEQFEKLKGEGITTVINLRAPTESNNLGVAEEALVKQLGVAYINIPVIFGALRDEAVDEFLQVTDDRISKGRLLIHCAAAVRVGAFWMIRRVLRNGWSFDMALAEANRIGLGNQPQLIEFARQYIAKHQTK